MAHNSRRLARRALRRVRAGEVLRQSGRMLTWASGLAIAIGVPTSIRVGGQAGFWIVGSLLAVGLLGGATLALAKPRRLVSAAAKVDEALRLDDRLSSAIELESATYAGDPAFSQLAVQDAERRATEVSVAQAVPIRLTRDWMLWPVLSAAAVAGMLLIPTLVQQAGQPSQGEIARARDSIVRAAQAVAEQLNAGGGAGEAADDETLARLDEIERELAEGRSTPERARTQSAAALEDRARALDEAARREADDLTRALRQIEPDRESSVAELAEALRRSDFAAASEQLREMARAAQRMDDESREALAEDLRALAEQIRRAEQRGLAAEQPNAGEDVSEESDATEPPTPSRPAPAEPSPESPGHQEAAEPKPRPEQPADGEPGQNETGSQPTDETPPNTGEQRRGQEGNRPTGEALSDRLDRVAEQIQRDPQSLQPDQPQAQPGEQRPDKPGDTPQEQPGREQTGGDRPSQPVEQPPGRAPGSPQERPGEQRPSQQTPAQPTPGNQTPPEGGQAGSAKGEQPDQKPEQGGQQQPAQPPSDRPGQQTPGAPPTAGSGEQGKPREEQRRGGESAPGGSPSDPPQPIGPGSPQPGTEPGNDQADPQSGRGGSLGEMLDQLENMDQRKLDAMRKMARSEKLREAAQELLNQASPEDLERLRGLAGRFGREPLFDEPQPTDGWNPQTEFFDARGKGADEQTPSRIVGAAEGTGAVPGRSIAGASRAEVAERVREAAAGAERAIEGQSIPPRMRNYVRNVYRRFEESAERPRVPEGRDADAPSRN